MAVPIVHELEFRIDPSPFREVDGFHAMVKSMDPFATGGGMDYTMWGAVWAAIGAWNKRWWEVVDVSVGRS